MLESEIQSRIMEYLRLKKVFCWRNNNTPVYDSARGVYRAMGKYAMKGVPDIQGVFGGRALFIEVKRPDTGLSDDQYNFMKEANAKGAITIIARDIEDVEFGLWGRLRYSSYYDVANYLMEEKAKDFKKSLSETFFDESMREEFAMRHLEWSNRDYIEILSELFDQMYKWRGYEIESVITYPTKKKFDNKLFNLYFLFLSNYSKLL